MAHVSQKITTRLQQAEEAIEQGLISYKEAGKALMDIRDEGLYKQSHDTFEAYLKERWNWERSYAHRLIEAAKVADNLLPIGNVPSNEAQARELTKLPTADLQRAAYGVAETIAEQNKAGKVTAKDVKNAVEIVHKVIQDNPSIKPEDIAAKAVEHGATTGIKPHEEPTPVEDEAEYTETDALHDQVAELQNIVAAGFIGTTDEDRANGLKLIADLRHEIKTLNATLNAVTISRDTFQRENAEMKKQLARQRNEIEKLKVKKC